MNATSDLTLSPGSPERQPAGNAPARAEPAAAPLNGVQMVAAYRAARAAQRKELRASLQQSHLARRRAREEHFGGEPATTEPRDKSATAGSVFANLVSLAAAERESTTTVAAPKTARPAPEPAGSELVASEGVASEPVVSEPAVSEPVVSEPVVSEPVVSEPRAEAPSVSPVVAQAADLPPAVNAEPVLPGDPAPALEEPTTTVAPPAEELAAAAPSADETAAEPTAPAEPPYDPPLAEIGFGPGMLIRLSQLGLHTTGDLAQANAAELRAALGDISRLVDVETWISNARHSAKAG